MAEEEEVETGEETEVEPKETEGETSETPHVCPQCGREFGSKQALSSHVGKAHKEEEEQKEGVGEEGIKPPEIARREQIIEDLREKLPKIYGISDNRADAIVDGIEDNPSILDNPRSLWYHIMEMCRGTNINTYQLNNALRGIYGENVAPQGQQPPTFGFQGSQAQGAGQLPPQTPYSLNSPTPPYQPQMNPQTHQLQQAEIQERMQQRNEEFELRKNEARTGNQGDCKRRGERESPRGDRRHDNSGSGESSTPLYDATTGERRVGKNSRTQEGN